jgi:hypothetical protein
MRRLGSRLTVGFASVLLLPSLALAQTRTSTAAGGLPNEDASWLFDLFTKAFHDKNWMLFSAGVLTLLIWVARRLQVLQVFPKAYLSWVSTAIAILSGVVLGLLDGKPLGEILATSISIGLMASGLWDSVGEMIRSFFQKIRGG